jgi:hypothetical protein
MRVVAALLDNAVQFKIPGLRSGRTIRIGLDPILGLVPVAGDVIGALGGLYIVYEAYRLGGDPRTLVLMVLNLVLDALIGMIPIVGDVFDLFFGANTRNLMLMGIDTSEPVQFGWGR